MIYHPFYSYQELWYCSYCYLSFCSFLNLFWYLFVVFSVFNIIARFKYVVSIPLPDVFLLLTGIFHTRRINLAICRHPSLSTFLACLLFPSAIRLSPLSPDRFHSSLPCLLLRHLCRSPLSVPPSLRRLSATRPPNDAAPTPLDLCLIICQSDQKKIGQFRVPHQLPMATTGEEARSAVNFYRSSLRGDKG